MRYILRVVRGKRRRILILLVREVLVAPSETNRHETMRGMSLCSSNISNQANSNIFHVG